MFTSSILAASAALISTVAAYANPGACSGDCWTHDPAVIRRSDGTYFRFSTGNKIGVYSAPALSGPWTLKGSAVPAGSSINLKGKDDLWAPDVQLIDGTYYLYYSVSSFGSQDSAIGYATSKTLDSGSWTDHGSTGVSSSSGKAYNAIDANVFVTSDGKKYMNFGSFWSDIYQTPLNSAGTKSSGNPTQISFTSSGTHAREGAFMYSRGGYYYLFWSEGQCCGYDSSKPAAGKEYKIMVCRSTSPTGGFVDKTGASCTSGGGTVVLESHGNVYGPGGQGVFADPKYGAVLYYHYVDTTVGYADGNKKFGWNTISWSTGWPVV
ncbi:hypothetical protein JX265_009906 [Neoarthrinium moseri]|uniref:Arabinan endo-1,5-alpha-L-arabinosidase n=1 Tax=Neoarthrinium moseri TaxID=1658444 RepID=A0A9Q0AM63_9PEZI|nr:uncharacterized protein JN550_008546 [Neoarthrinium moseri]KAI1843167.1 hypothetical protein JX266_010694 [Neoarthrinium moseri]KAI1860507.1 hypothetical protein JX265_009906 [Neoarthrinium moseri]KAI1865000.1 hypothetical protein JN550_008546 [Neoarthrinium moseri]